MEERVKGVSEREVDGAVCIVGLPRTLPRKEVYSSIRNVLLALNFTKLLHIFILHPERPGLLNEDTYRFDAEAPPTLEELLPAFTAIPPHVLLTVPIPREGHPAHRKCNATWWNSCNSEWKSLELCFEQVKLLERLRGHPFDWVVRMRPDLWF